MSDGEHGHEVYDGYDVIGDVHGHAERLEALLRSMGYVERDRAWRHPSRQAVFVGDLVDRGPGQLETVRIARSMVDAGSARIVLGNHEFNAIAYATPDPGDPTRHLRPGHLDPAPATDPETGPVGADKREKNHAQHASYLEQVGGFGSALHREHIEWFMTIPLWLDLGALRVVHACWHEASIRAIAEQVGSGDTLTPRLVERASREGNPEYGAVEILLKGPEISLGDGRGYHDKDGHPRHRARTRWWQAGATTLRDLALIPHGVKLAGDWPDGQLPDTDVDPSERITYDADVPVIVGHYWASGDRRVWHPKVACVDYSVAKRGPLVAYRWSGEGDLIDANHRHVGTA